MTSLVMFDDVSVGLLPAGYGAYAGYADGIYANLSAIRARFPQAHILDIAVSASVDATCLDVEYGDATNAQAVEWVKRQHARGLHRPVVYTSAGNARALINTLASNGVPRNSYVLWTAHYTGYAHICGNDGYPAADGTQFTDTAMGRSLDESLVSDAFFGGSALTPGGVYTPVLTEGMSGNAVKTVQTRLNAWQDTVTTYQILPVTGKFDAATKQAVIDFQTYAKLSVDGQVGPETLGALEKNPPGIPVNLSHNAYVSYTDFGWGKVAGAKEYDFQLVEWQTGKQVYRTQTAATNAEKVATSPGTEYYWRVAAIPGKGWTEKQKFTTPAPPPPPAKAAYPAPANLKINPLIKRVISWSAATLDGHPAPSYTVQIFNSAGKQYAETTVTGTSLEISVPAGTYSIHVWANSGPSAPPHATLTLDTK